MRVCVCMCVCMYENDICIRLCGNSGYIWKAFTALRLIPAILLD